jgi:hypothetical protein
MKAVWIGQPFSTHGEAYIKGTPRDTILNWGYYNEFGTGGV